MKVSWGWLGTFSALGRVACGMHFMGLACSSGPRLPGPRVDANDLPCLQQGHRQLHVLTRYLKFNSDSRVWKALIRDRQYGPPAKPSLGHSGPWSLNNYSMPQAFNSCICYLFIHLLPFHPFHFTNVFGRMRLILSPQCQVWFCWQQVMRVAILRQEYK